MLVPKESAAWTRRASTCKCSRMCSLGVQTLERNTAIRLSREVNDWLGAVIQEYPTRFAGFAMLPTQSPIDAADELERTVSQLGFKGALINGHTNGRYLDEDSFSPIFERAQALDVPIYIHPTDPPQAIIDIYYKDCPAMMQSWGWQVETGTHLLRLISRGVFDRFPNLKIIVGHMGELIPFGLKRINTALTMGNWLLASQSKVAESAEQRCMQKSVFYYMRANVLITTSGVFDQAALNCAIAELGIDNILFSVDDPFGDNFEGMDFLNKAQLSKEDKEKLAHENAERILKLAPEPNLAEFKPLALFFPGKSQSENRPHDIVLIGEIKSLALKSRQRSPLLCLPAHLATPASTLSHCGRSSPASWSIPELELKY